MKIPLSGRKKALFIVDVQSAFINSRNQYIVKKITHLLNTIPYDFYVTVSFHAEKGSLWDKQQGWTCPRDDKSHTFPDIVGLLNPQKCISIVKTTKSVFKGDKNLFTLLKDEHIEEVHIVGLDTNDCVLASAYEAFDLGFFTYVIEEGCESSSSSALHKSAVALLRQQNMTNNSCIEKIRMANI